MKNIVNFFFCILFLVVFQNIYSQSKNESKDYKNYSFFEFPDGERVYLRHSTIDQVIMKLGLPSSQDYHEFGTDDFWWDDYWTYRYESDNLIIDYYAPTREIIAVYANFSELLNYGFPFKIDSQSRKNEIFSTIKSDINISDFREGSNYLHYYVGKPEDNWLAGFLSFNSKKPQYSMFYEVPWDDSYSFK